MNHTYQVGGSLNVNASSYVARKADTQLYEALLRGEFCYVFNSRQMGKSSLRVRVKKRLEAQGYACVSLDMSNIGGKTITPLQWYKGIASELWRGFRLIGKVKFKSWWGEQQGLSSIQQLDRFISDIVLPEIAAEKLFIFIDEIDSVISLDFSTDDFFALIRYFYNQRAENPDYQRLSFALFGVATPRDLIRDRDRTPFNIGTAIELEGFTLDEATPLISNLQDGFKDSSLILKEILYWTGGQPFLTQKVCKLALNCSQKAGDCPLPGNEAQWVESLVTKYIIHNWASQDEPEHLRTIRDRLLRDESKAGRLLGISKKIFQRGFVFADDSLEQKYLLLSNLIIKKNSQLVFRNLLYQQIFNLEWLEQQLNCLRPYGTQVEQWLASRLQDNSRLLRGNALQQAQIWANNHNISQSEYQFLNASVAQEQAEIRRDLELARLQAVEVRLTQENKVAKLQRFLLGTVSTALLAMIALSTAVYWNYRQAKVQEIDAHLASAKSQFNSDRYFESLINAIVAKQESKTILYADSSLDERANLALQQAVYNLTEKNTFSGHEDVILGVSVSPDGQTIASASADTTIKLWQKNGKLLTTLTFHRDSVQDVNFSPDGKNIVSASEDNTIRLWTSQGKLLRTLSEHRSTVNRVVYAPQGDIFASVSEDMTVRLWDRDGNPQNVLHGHQSGIMSVAFSNDGQLIATGDRNGQLKLWYRDGTLLRTIDVFKSPLRGIDFAPNNRQIVTGGDNNTVRVLDLHGTLLQILSGYDAPVTAVKFSPDGKTIGTGSWDNTVKLWSTDGTLISNFKGHQGRIWSLDWWHDSSTVVTGGWDNVVKLWQVDRPLIKTFHGHTSSILKVVFHPENKFLASASVDGTVKLWNTNGTLLTDFKKHTTEAYDIAFSNDGELIASTSYDRTIKLWRVDGMVLETLGNIDVVTNVQFAPDGFAQNDREIMISGGFDPKIYFWELQKSKNRVKAIVKKTISAHTARITDIDISRDGKLIVSVSHDCYLKLWKPDGTEIRSVFADKTGVKTVAISRDQKLIATGGKEQNIKIWNIEGELITILEGHSAIVLDVEFSPDGSTIASASADNTVKIWDRSGKLLTTLQGHQGGVWDVEFSPDGKQVATASEDKQVKLWDLERILKLNTLDYSCIWIKDYLETNVLVRNDSHSLCQFKNQT